jgi:hypothetical protein
VFAQAFGPQPQHDFEIVAMTPRQFFEQIVQQHVGAVLVGNGALTGTIAAFVAAFREPVDDNMVNLKTAEALGLIVGPVAGLWVRKATLCPSSAAWP